MERPLLGVVFVLLLLQTRAFDIKPVRQLVASKNATCLLVFGDSSVDPGNNNHLPTTVKCNFPPYGKDFSHGLPTGRFTNGRLPTDIIGAGLGFTTVIPGFLDKSLKKEDLLHGVSFASSGSGYDDLTANLSTVLTFSQQIKYLKHYKIHLRAFVGKEREEEIVGNAMFILSAGTNDFVQSYFPEPTRQAQFTVEQYADFLVTNMGNHIKEMHRLGGQRFVVVGAPPFGCMPLIKTVRDEKDCDAGLNQVAKMYNSKVQAKLTSLKKVLHVRDAYVDVYAAFMDAIMHPRKYGFTVTTRGCCGTGQIEFGDTCRGLSTCPDASKYVYWDAVHPTERMYEIIADYALASVGKELFN